MAAHIKGMSNDTDVTVIATEIQYIAGTSDKFYRSFVIEGPDGPVVTFQYGRNGTSGSFTPRKEFKDSAAAAKAAEKKLAGKIGEGYNPTAAGTLAFDHSPTDSELDQAANKLPSGPSGVSMPALREQSATVVAANAAAPVDAEAFNRITDHLSSVLPHPACPVKTDTITRPMLAAILPSADLAYVLSASDWVMQPKLDGDRVVVEVIDGVVSVLNRSGQPKVKNVGESHLAPFRVLTSGRWVFDGEVVGRKLWLFDMPAAGEFHDEVVPFVQRYETLAATFDALGIAADDEHIGLVATTSGTEAKRKLLADAEAAGREGVMFRAQVASYQPGRRSEDLLKHKFVKEIDAFVTRVNVGGKDNAELAVHTETGEVQVVGQVTTIGKGPIAVGDVVEVAFLYIVNPASPRLYQPRIMRVRTDKAAAECSIEQLAHAVTDKTVG